MTVPDDPLPEDAYLRDFLGAMGLDSALRSGWIDRLLAGERLPENAAGATLSAMLVQAGVLKNGDLTHAMRVVLDTRREILEQKLRFLRLAARDVAGHLDALLTNLPRFMGESETFALFRYDRAMTTRPEDIDATRKWVDYVTALSRAEAPHLAPELPLDAVTRLLEIGGNTGVMARAVLDRHADMRATILDLPAVCALGRELRPHDRLTFHPGDARRDPLPEIAGRAPEAVLFKSVLHDWPEAEARALMSRALESLPPGGRIVVCERGALGAQALPFSMTANLVFAPFYRDPGFYERALESAGCDLLPTREVVLDMPFFIVCGIRK